MDWRELFKRYIEIVGFAEGVTFLHECDWTEEEWGEISTAQSEAFAEEKHLRDLRLMRYK